jgi:hypothetical protein
VALVAPTMVIHGRGMVTTMLAANALDAWLRKRELRG